MRADIEKKTKSCSACLTAGKNLKFELSLIEKIKLEPRKMAGKEKQIDFTGNLNNKKTTVQPIYTNCSRQK